MDPTSAWTSLDAVKVASSIATPLLIAVLGFIFTLAIRRIEWAREAQRGEEQKRKELVEEEGRLAPHVELDVACRFMGPSQRRYLAEFSVTVNNKGTHIHRFPKIILRVRGIRHGEELKLWANNEPRLSFPEKLFETDLVPSQWTFVFVQPTVKQCITCVTYIDEGFQFVLANAEFHYDRWTPHTVEKVFEIPRMNEP